MMANDVERADKARQQGNEFYKAGKIKQAIVAYEVAASLAPSDPTPLSNLSAAAFETGAYEKCIQFITRALALLDGRLDEEPLKQKLLVRMVKTKLHLSSLADGRSFLARVSPGKEQETLQDALNRLETVYAESSSVDSDLMRRTLLKLPRYKPHLTDEADYFSVGHDVPESQYSKALQKTTKDSEAISFLFCGIGDARNLFQTIAVYHQRGPKANQRIHFTILDHKPAVIARDLIIFALLDSLVQPGFSVQRMGSLSKADRILFKETLSTISYLYTTQVIPAYAWALLQKTIERILKSFQKNEQHISWVYVPTSVQQAICQSLASWQQTPSGPYTTQRFRQLTWLHNVQQIAGRGAMLGDSAPTEAFPELKLDHRVFEEFNIVLPEGVILEARDPELAKMIKEYRKGNKTVQDRISNHINSTWKTNMTLVDLEWENDRHDYKHTPDLGFTPFDVVDVLEQGLEDIRGPRNQRGETIISHAELFFLGMVKSVSALRDRMIVEACLGEMADVMERIRYHQFDRRCESFREDPLSSISWPDKYHVIHMSNIPDYVGGPLTSFLYASPLLKSGPGTGLTSTVLRNPPKWKSIDQFLAEYLLLYDRELIRTHFSLKLSTEIHEDSNDIYHQMGLGFSLMDYVLWERTESQPLTFEQLMPKQKLTKWLHAVFLKLCLPYPRPKMDHSLVYAPLNLTTFLRLLSHIAELGYPAHWLSPVVTSLLEGEITTITRAPRRLVLLQKDVDEAQPPRKMATKPWSMEFATLLSLWESTLPFGLIAPSLLVPRTQDIFEYTIAFPAFTNDDPHIPHFMLVFYDENTFGTAPKQLRPLLLDDETGSNSAVHRDVRARGVRILTTFQWNAKNRSATFWMSHNDFEAMVQDNWRIYVWRMDSWEKESGALELQKAVVEKRAWNVWTA